MRFEVKDGSFSYGERQILNNISFCIDGNEIMAVLGPNGVGKTTLLRCMMGMLTWDSGQTFIDGAPLKEMKQSEIWQKIAYVPQSKSIDLSYTALEMVLMGRSSRLGLFSQPTRNDTTLARDALASVGVTFSENKPCSEMSGGELQMVLIARALCAQPEMLILDEPESNLDFRNQLVILDILKNLSREKGIAAIINTHYPEHAIKVSDKSLILNRNGRSIYGPSESVITEENLANAFSVSVKIIDFDFNGKKYRDVIPIEMLDEQG